jgi:ABC-type lipoprotein release transport system permease subunit
MKMAIKLAMQNLIGAGLRTWLNVIVLSFAFVVIIWHKGLLDGWDRQAKQDMVKWEYGAGQFWQVNFDPFDPFTIIDSHSEVPGEIQNAGETKTAPVLITQGTLYPKGRLYSILVKGIEPEQKVIDLPTGKLVSENGEIPAIIGTGMAKSTHLKTGDLVTLRWRDKNGAFDATEIQIKHVFKTNVPSVDVNQIWIPIETLREMMLLPREATIIIAGDKSFSDTKYSEWVFQDNTVLLEDIEKIIQSKSIGGVIVWGILLLLAMLAIFDTQVLSIFRRQKEIGTYIAMGMTRTQVVTLFTVEGAMHSVLAALVGAVYGIPLLALQAINGIKLPFDSSDYGVTAAERLFPVYSLGLILSTVILVLLVTTFVSYIPARKIAKLNPTDALRGKM